MPNDGTKNAIANPVPKLWHKNCIQKKREKNLSMPLQLSEESFITLLWLSG